MPNTSLNNIEFLLAGSCIVIKYTHELFKELFFIGNREKGITYSISSFHCFRLLMPIRKRVRLMKGG